MKRHIFLILMAFLIAAPGALAQDGDGWETYYANDYGFSMLVPAGTRLETKEWPGGWAGLYGEHEGVAVIGVARLGEWASAEEIERFGVEVTGIPDEKWTEIDRGEGHGWKWYRTVKATQGSKLVFGGYGTGPKGSYLLLLVTTPSDFNEYRADYDTWYESIRLH